MLFRSLSVILLAALALANPLVGRSEVTALQKAFTGLTNTFSAVRDACSVFATNVDNAHAEDIFSLMGTLDSLLINASKVVPDVLDGEWICDGYRSSLSLDHQVADAFMARKDDFQTVGLVNDTCLIFQETMADTSLLEGKLLNATPDSWKACVQRYQGISRNISSAVLKAYSCGSQE
ncbi:uncharacterized protein EV420DRAFT_1549454 [Desarmillaria tabescens]|uniref:Uncharacterized protein n=1 Tax=Armillaria tabescens TaxID=1929756 RepID=A0AA39K9T3_ARMTA|nr:uncharacterized protein EV420DRAFT_1549454 [Desarmillaria tabescens]KAK0457221.1 hypothetical protein EV420DRAFT_1549454 [Desarmillaria tabescens]